MIFTYIFFTESHKDVLSEMIELAASDNLGTGAINVHFTMFT